MQLVVYRVAQEALSNAARHSGAETRQGPLCASAATGDRVELTVGDDGSGFTFDQAARGLGIAGMRERALLVGGDVEVESRPNVGTRVSLSGAVATSRYRDEAMEQPGKRSRSR